MSKNYLEMYAKKETPKFQAGGAMPEGGAPAGPEGAPAGGGGQDPQAMLMQVLETQDPNMALEFCNMIGQQMQGGGEGAPAPAMENGGRMSYKAPVFKKGGKL